MKTNIISTFILATAVGMAACNTNLGDETVTETASFAGLAASTLPDKADIVSPAAKWELPKELREISGIALLPGNIMAGVQDEEGIIYLYDLSKKAIVDKISFGKPGDYEGIVVVGGDAFILRSDGAILEVADFRNGKPKAIEHETVLASSQNTEGMAYDKAGNRLLIACKGHDERLGNNKGIYAFTLADKTMHANPVIIIPLDQSKLADSGKKRKNKYDVLQPSSLEIHPLTGELYLLDAKNFYLLTIDKKGTIKKLVNLDKSLLRQPEGLTFGSNGEMYIASEGSKKGNGVLLKYAAGI
ncbi:SdiA-regulated domain-containing protein [Pontibacter sp. 172403-2]|uniref:SdiA-regulated domain-containing protein n=1 Tax=Pontibacter rufus TaxID=2791028 RepID=UPI0018AFFFC9|nr:SdiA-regulated domain-containing protein [Pontibacter sp. 172403-2]MBF9255119.1 SdiA-regulated domain-containing protein [Pontibacter sp. 172403-2]